MNDIPRSALLLGLAGVLPFLCGVITYLSPAAFAMTMAWVGPRFVGPYVGLAYGTVILAFMSGVLWGFATKADGPLASTGYALSTLPALWAFFMVGGGPTSAAINLVTGFVALLFLDWFFSQQGLAPAWWMKLRIVLTALVIACLLVPVFL